MRAWLPAALLLILVACGRTERKEPAPALAPAAATEPWTWHPLGGLAVIEGEVLEGTELVLEGRSIRERRYAEPGPVRWEFFRPPEGESALLRTADGRELARFTFAVAQPPRARATAQSPPAAAPQVKAAPSPAPPPEPPAQARTEARLSEFIAKLLPGRKMAPPPAPAVPPTAPPQPVPGRIPTLVEPVPPPPGTLAEARMGEATLRSLPERRSTLPAAPGEAPAALPRRASAITPLLVEPAPAPVPRPAPVTLMTPVGPPGHAWPGMGEALNLTRGPSGQRRLLLSFDGGSSNEVAAEVLDILKARGVRTTLFLTGAFIQRFPALVKRMAAEGHELGNHTMNHPHFAPGMKRDPKWTRERIQKELLDADAALVRTIGRPMDPYWRAPYGEHTAEIRRWAEELGYRHVGWSEGADTLDWATPKERKLYRSGEAIVARLQQRLNRDGDGLIVLMHLGSARELGDRPTDGLGAFMDRARKEGWSFVSVGTILRDLGKPVWNPQQRLALLTGAPAQGR